MNTKNRASSKDSNSKKQTKPVEEKNESTQADSTNQSTGKLTKS